MNPRSSADKPPLPQEGEQDTGISPVIGTILMVAITVVLAAVLMVVVTDVAGDVSPNPEASVYITDTPTGVELTLYGVSHADSVQVKVGDDVLHTWDISSTTSERQISLIGVSTADQITVIGSVDGQEQVIETHVPSQDYDVALDPQKGTISQSAGELPYMYLASGDKVFKFDTANGNKEQVTETGLSWPLSYIDEDDAYFSVGDWSAGTTELYHVDKDGNMRSLIFVDSSTVGDWVIGENYLYTTDGSTNDLVTYDRDTGTEVNRVGVNEYFAPVTVHDGTVYGTVKYSFEGVMAIDSETGAVEYNETITSESGQIMFQRIGGQDGTLYTTSKDDGDYLNQVLASGENTRVAVNGASGIATTTDSVFIGQGSDGVNKYDSETLSLDKSYTSSDYQTVVGATSEAYYVQTNSALIKYDVEDGSEVWRYTFEEYQEPGTAGFSSS